MKTFDNVASLKLARLNANQFVETGGFTEKGGTGAKRYFTKTAAQAAADGDVIDDVHTNFVLANGIVAIDTSKPVIEHYTLSEAKALTGAVIGQQIIITDRNNAPCEFIASTVNNEKNLIENTGSSLTIKVQKYEGLVRTSWVANRLDTDLIDEYDNVIVDSNFTIAENVIINLGKSVTIEKNSTVSVNFDGYAFTQRSGSSLLGDGRILYTVPTTSGPVLMQPDGVVDFASTNFPTLGNLILQSNQNFGESGHGIMWDMTLGNGSFARVGFVRIRGFDKAMDFNVPSGQFITSVEFEELMDIYCRATMDESGNAGQISDFHFNKITVQPLGDNTPSNRNREYGIKSDAANFFSCDSAVFWDWDTKTNPATIKEKILFGPLCRKNYIVTPTSNSSEITDKGVENTIIANAGGGTIKPKDEGTFTPSGAGFNNGLGTQDNFLAKADKLLTVNSSPLQSGTTINRPFDSLPQNYAQFLADGNEQFIEIDFAGSKRVGAFGIGFTEGFEPDYIRLEVSQNGVLSYSTLYETTAKKQIHAIDTGAFRNDVEAIRISFSKASGSLRVPMMFAYSPDNRGQMFLDADGYNQMYNDIVFNAGAQGKGLSLIDNTTGVRRRLIIDNGVVTVV